MSGKYVAMKFALFGVLFFFTLNVFGQIKTGLPDLLINGKPIDYKSGIVYSDSLVNSELSVVMGDTSWQITLWEVNLVRGATPIERLKLTDNSVELKLLLSKAQSGDRVIVQLMEAVNEEGEKTMLRNIYNIPLR